MSAATGGHAKADELPARKRIEQLKLQRVGIFTALNHFADNDGLDTQYRPVVEVDIGAIGRLLQHVALARRRESSAAAQVVLDDGCDIQRCCRRTALPAEGNHGYRRRLGDTLHVDDEFLGRRTVRNGGRQGKYDY
jgi:hypothetical protein